MFFDPRRYDLAKVGRYKFNKKLDAERTVSADMILAEDVVNLHTGEMIAEKGTKVTQRDLRMRSRTLPFLMYGSRQKTRAKYQRSFQI